MFRVVNYLLAKENWISNWELQIAKYLFMQAEVLAKYKPKINTSQLLQDLKHIEELAANATEYFKSTHHVVLYYEDLVNSRTVSKFHISVKMEFLSFL